MSIADNERRHLIVFNKNMDEKEIEDELKKYIDNGYIIAQTLASTSRVIYILEKEIIQE